MKNRKNVVSVEKAVSVMEAVTTIITPGLNGTDDQEVTDIVLDTLRTARGNTITCGTDTTRLIDAVIMFIVNERAQYK